MKTKKIERLLHIPVILILTAAVFLMAAGSASAASRSVKFGGEITIQPGDTAVIDMSGTESAASSDGYIDGTYTWLKFRPEKTGRLKVAAQKSICYTWLTDSSKKVLSGDWGWICDDIEVYNSVSFGVKKGRTYYIKVRGYAKEKRCEIKTSFTPQGVTGGAKKSKAKSVKKNKWQKGLILIGTKSARWYKIKLKKSQRVSLYFKLYGNGYTYLYAWSKKTGGITRKIWRDNILDGYTEGNLNDKTKCMRTPKLPKGTVIYVKVFNKKKTDSGFYQIKWK